MGKFDEKKKKSKKKKKSLPGWYPWVKTATVLVTLVLMLAAGKVLVDRYVYFNGLKPVILAGDTVDLRETTLTVEEYEKLAENTDGDILWNVPIGGAYFDSSSEHIILSDLTEEEVGHFAYFPALKSVDATRCPDHGALAKLEAEYPQLQISWEIHLGSKAWARDAKFVDLRGQNVTLEQLQEGLVYFAEGTQIQLNDGSLTEQDREKLKAAFPELDIFWGVELMGKVYSTGETKLSLAGKKVDVEALIAAGPEFLAMEEIDLTGCGCSLEELVAVSEAFGGPLIRCELELYGKKFTTDAQELDFSGIKMKDTTAIEQAVQLMPDLKKVIMSDCGISNEEMDALNKRHEKIQFVWTVYFSVYSLRTDATAFCASNLPDYGYIAIKMNDKQIAPLKYCTELVALDLGHMRYTNLSFLENMHKLKYLVLVEAKYTDISVLAQMEELFYLELFKNTLDDLTPLLQCKNLRHLNIGYTRGFDYSPLKEMTWLERLWFPGHKLTKDQAQEIVDALPDTQVYMPQWDADGSTGGGWRETDVYYEMRNVFDMFYQPGGTGTGKKN